MQEVTVDKPALKGPSKCSQNFWSSSRHMVYDGFIYVCTLMYTSKCSTGLDRSGLDPKLLVPALVQTFTNKSHILFHKKNGIQQLNHASLAFFFPCHTCLPQVSTPFGLGWCGFCGLSDSKNGGKNVEKLG